MYWVTQYLLIIFFFQKMLLAVLFWGQVNPMVLHYFSRLPSLFHTTLSQSLTVATSSKLAWKHTLAVSFSPHSLFHLLAHLPADQMLVVLEVVFGEDLTVVGAGQNAIKGGQAVTLLQDAAPQHLDAARASQSFVHAVLVDPLPGAGSIVHLRSSPRRHEHRGAHG